MSSSRGGRSGASSSKGKHSQQARDEVYGWFQSMMPSGSEKIPNYRALVHQLVDEALERGFTFSSLTRENWQVVLYEGTIRMIQGDLKLWATKWQVRGHTTNFPFHTMNIINSSFHVLKGLLYIYYVYDVLVVHVMHYF